MMTILFLLPMDAMGKPGLLLLLLPVLVIFGILVGVYTARQRMKRRATERSS